MLRFYIKHLKITYLAVGKIIKDNFTRKESYLQIG